MLLGVVLRALAVVGGGMALYLCTDWYRTRGVALWVWLIGVYLSTIAVEIALQVRALGLARRERTTG